MIWTVAASADSGDVKVSTPSPGQHPFQTGVATVNAPVNGISTVTVTVTGGWSWPTHGKDCNTDRAGTGISVNWFDPKDRGNHVAFFDVNGDGTTNTTVGGVDDFGVGAGAGDPRNAADNVVHPTENDGQYGTGAVVDITDPSSFANWRGGCGVFTSDTILVRHNTTPPTFTYTTGVTAHGNFGKAASGDKDFSGTLFSNPTPPASGALQQGALLRHTYANTDDLTRLCALTYDVHTGKAASANSGVGIPGNAKEVTAGDQAIGTVTKYTAIHNSDNSIQSNGGTPAGNTCPAFFFPKIPTTATGPVGGTFAADGTVSVSDTVHLQGADPQGTGTLRVRIFGPTNTTCTGNGLAHSDKSLTQVSNNVNHDYSFSFDQTVVTTKGDYRFTADLYNGSKNPDTDTSDATSACNAANELAHVDPRPTTLTTDAGGPYDPVASLTDTATLSGGTDDATGTITFKLFKDDGTANHGCDGQVGSDVTATVSSTADANGKKGANGKTYTSPSVAIPGPGLYHWTASYGGDGVKNDSSASGCGANKENPKVKTASIAIDKSPDGTTVENGDTITFTILVTNTGEADLTNVTVTDPKAPDCRRDGSDAGHPTLGTLLSGHDTSYQCTSPALTASDTNRATATGTAGNLNPSAFDDAPYTVIHPDIDVLKNPPTQSVPLNGTATFHITVKNTGDTPLTNVVVNDPFVKGIPNNCTRDASQTDPLIKGVGNHDGTFDVGESFTYDCTAGPITDGFTNVAQACGTDKLGKTVCDTSDNGGPPPTPECPESSRCGSVSIEGLSSTQDFKPADNGTLTITGPHNPANGNLTFNLYKGTCINSHLLYTDTVAVNANGSASTQAGSYLSALLLAHPAILQGTNGTYNWQITYDGDTNGNADVDGACGTENFVVTNG